MPDRIEYQVVAVPNQVFAPVLGRLATRIDVVSGAGPFAIELPQLPAGSPERVVFVFNGSAAEVVVVLPDGRREAVPPPSAHTDFDWFGTRWELTFTEQVVNLRDDQQLTVATRIPDILLNLQGAAQRVTLGIQNPPNNNFHEIRLRNANLFPVVVSAAGFHRTIGRHLDAEWLGSRQRWEISRAA